MVNLRISYRRDRHKNIANTLSWAFYILVFYICHAFRPHQAHNPNFLYDRIQKTNHRNGDVFFADKRNFQRGSSDDMSEDIAGLQGALAPKIGLESEVSKMNQAEVSVYKEENKPTSPPPQINVADEQYFPFQAEVSRVMDIIVNSLYTDKDVFLREMVSNAADALDKRRVKADPQEQIPKETFGGIRIIPNKENNTLTIEDDGIGMTPEELQKNLGTIAESGTAKFLQQYESGRADSNLIGQFGVGFYSAFLVSDVVEVFSRAYGHEGNPVHRWKSTTAGTYSVAQVADEAVNRDFMKCGTRIVLHLKPECDDYLEDYKLKELLRKYSEFVRFPIQVWVEKVEYERVPEDSTAVEGKPGRYKTVTKKRHEWEVVNTQLPIWRRKQEEIRPEDYVAFYKSTFKAFDDPLSYIHFKVEGQVEFSCLLFVPGSLPWELSRNMFDEESRGIRLYVKRVFINDKFSEAIPRWLTFVRGVVDSDELALNVGREYLQRSKALAVINKRIATKAIDMIKNLKQSSPERFVKFTENFGKYIKVGVVEDRENQQELGGLVTFYSTTSATKKTTLDEYIERMQPKQPAIYYITTENISSALNSPSLEKLKQLNYEVLFSLEPIDEFCLASLAASKYKNVMLLDVSKSDLRLPEEVAQAAQLQQDQKIKSPASPAEFESLCGWLKGLFNDRVQDVKISDRLVESPALLVQTDFGLSPSMQRYMKQQATSAGMNETELFGTSMVTKPVFEININHPIIRQLNDLVKTDKLSDVPRRIARQLLDVVAIQGGYNVDDPSDFCKGVLQLMQREANTYLGSSSPNGGIPLDHKVVTEEKPQAVEQKQSVEATPVDTVAEETVVDNTL